MELQFNEDGMREIVIEATKNLNPDATPEELEEIIAEALKQNGYKP